ncbi:DNA repair exonuclease SbcCD ATPase subunit [Catalinimonas alkaloidigena]|uniref:Cbp1 family collagen-binding glycoprotein adhesin n=1 Tax=Catalinimonas alkaloidigena TaxID=1075417 RepID=UPI0024071B9E|nr:hypothetical protein [Catalinimonas alkaloidigena]MDF9796689.1 DNA repair exonuclease SbcCD ATPase subunit [Catalinimonas alkaloidigena]
MKAQIRNLAIVSALSIGLFSCENKEMQEKISRLSSENQQLEQKFASKDSSLINFIESFAEIESNLSDIREREMNIQLNKEKNLSTEDLKLRIREDVEEINRLLIENREKIASLNAQLKYSGRQNAKLKASMNELQESLTAKIEAKETEIGTLTEELASMKIKVDELNTNLASLKDVNDQKEQTIISKVEELNTAYFVTGTFKQLRDNQVLSKEGGFLGLGRTEVLKDNFNKQQFNQIDIRQTLQFPVEGEEIELVTSHPTDSYSLEKNDEEKLNLVVSDPEKFWESSKYLVMVVK